MELKIGFLCSGGLGLHTLKVIDSLVKPQFILTDKNSIEIIDFAKINSIPIFIGNPRNGHSSDFLQNFDTDIIFSINYLFIVNYNILNHPKRYAINFHGSLLPKYRGRTPHVWSIINGEKETGVTAHIMEEGCDTGDIVLQNTIPIEENQTGADILAIYKEIYSEMIETILTNIEKDKLKLKKQEHEKATYFGKRTLEDGRIDWNWQKERIYNWVRAQADPYPGAFSFINNQKITIDKIQYSDFGFNYEMPNGLILQTKPDILVKTPNGVIKLLTIRERKKIKFSENTQLA